MYCIRQCLGQLELELFELLNTHLTTSSWLGSVTTISPTASGIMSHVTRETLSYKLHKSLEFQAEPRTPKEEMLIHDSTNEGGWRSGRLRLANLQVECSQSWCQNYWMARILDHEDWKSLRCSKLSRYGWPSVNICFDTILVEGRKWAVSRIKARLWLLSDDITLARAIYLSAKLILLNDILAALDIHTWCPFSFFCGITVVN